MQPVRQKASKKSRMPNAEAAQKSNRVKRPEPSAKSGTQKCRHLIDRSSNPAKKCSSSPEM